MNSQTSMLPPLADEETLKAIAVSIVNHNLNETVAKKLDNSRDISVSNVSWKQHAYMKNTYLVTFSICDSQAGNIQTTSVLMKTEYNSMNSREFQAYSTLFKDMQCPSTATVKLNISSSQEEGNLYRLIPQSYLIQKSAVFLENLEENSTEFRTMFYGSNDCPTPVDFNHCLLAVETLARFHASSYILRKHLGEKGKGKLEMLKKYPFINPQSSSSLYSRTQTSKLSSIFEKGFELACRIIETDNPSLVFKLRRKVDSSLIFEKVVKLVEEEKYDNDDFYVVCHGSFLPDNVLFKYNDDEPWECRIINFGSVYMGPLASDLAVFLLNCTSLQFRDQFEEKLLAFYCDAFQEQIQSHGRCSSGAILEIIHEFEENIDEFHRKLEKQYKKMLEFGFYHACLLLPILSYMKQSNRHNNNHKGSNTEQKYEQFFNSSLTIHELIVDFNDCLIGDSADKGRVLEFEKFVMDNPILRKRLEEIVEQLVRNRVLF